MTNRAFNYWRRRAYRAERALHEQRVRAAKWFVAKREAEAETKEWRERKLDVPFFEALQASYHSDHLFRLGLMNDRKAELLDDIARLVCHEDTESSDLRGELAEMILRRWGEVPANGNRQ